MDSPSLNYSIETRNLTKYFYSHKGIKNTFFPQELSAPAVDNINIQIHEGEVFGLIGPNGAGKTTLTKILCTLLLPTSGNAFIEGIDILKDGNRVRKNITLISGEERSFYWRLTGRQNLEFFACLHNLNPIKIRTKINETIDFLSLRDIIDERFDTYSTGYKQRLSIGRGLLTNAKVFFLDEPTKSLDPLIAEDLLKLIRNVLSRELRKTIFLVTQDMHEAEIVCDRIAIMNHGKIINSGTPLALRQYYDLSSLNEVFRKVIERR